MSKTNLLINITYSYLANIINITILSSSYEFIRKSKNHKNLINIFIVRYRYVNTNFNCNNKMKIIS